MNVFDQVQELTSMSVGMSVIGAVSAGVWPIKLLVWGASKLMEALG